MNAPIIIEMEDPILHHLPQRPFCPIAQYPDCPCRDDLSLIGEYVAGQIERNEVDYAGARAIWRGESEK